MKKIQLRTDLLRAALSAVTVGLATVAVSPAVECDSHAVRSQVAALVQEIEAVVDPCGDSAEVASVLEAFRRCDPSSYRICIDRHSVRNYVDPGARDQPPQRTALVWNPDLRTELESSCDGDGSRPVLRDPTASLLHEIVHVVQDCSGLDPAAHEADAVRIENIYRRARGLCQRTRYGSELLPASTFVACGTDSCSCPPNRAPLPASPPVDRPELAASTTDAGETVAGDTGH